MAIKCSRLNVVVPIEYFNMVYEGGFDKFKEENKHLFDRGNSFDKELICFTAMGSSGIDYWIKTLESFGLIGVEGKGDDRRWKDFCVIDWYGLTFPCDWVILDNEKRSVSLNTYRLDRRMQGADIEKLISYNRSVEEYKSYFLEKDYLNFLPEKDIEKLKSLSDEDLIIVFKSIVRLEREFSWPEISVATAKWLYFEIENRNIDPHFELSSWAIKISSNHYLRSCLRDKMSN